MKEIFIVGIGGFAGSALRYAISLLVLSMWGQTKLPIATFAVNIVGSAVIGLLINMFSLTPGGYIYFLCVVGFCGGFTTFSTFSLEMVKMLQTGEIFTAFAYAVVSVILCVSATWGAMQIKL